MIKKISNEDVRKMKSSYNRKPTKISAEIEKYRFYAYRLSIVIGNLELKIEDPKHLILNAIGYYYWMWDHTYWNGELEKSAIWTEAFMAYLFKWERLGLPITPIMKKILSESLLTFINGLNQYGIELIWPWGKISEVSDESDQKNRQ